MADENKKNMRYYEPEGAPEGAAALAERVVKALYPRPLGVVHVVANDGVMPLGVRHLLGTEDANNESARTQEERLGRCFELTGWAIAMNYDAPTRMRLVHGSIQGKPRGDETFERIGHAWLLVDDLTWEPATACFYDRAEFYDTFQARDEVSYTRGQAAKNVANFGNFGRWHESRYPAYSGPRYACALDKCSFKTDDRREMKAHAVVVGHMGWIDYQKMPRDLV